MVSEFENKKSTKHAIKKSALDQAAKVIWMTGLSGSGKTTIASNLNKLLHNDGFITKVIDGDELRKGLCKDLGYNETDRKENIRRAAEIAKLFVDSGVVVICCFISPTYEMRDLAKNIIGEDRFIEVYIDCPFNVCENRDVKGYYAKARKGDLKNFTGIDSSYEAPVTPDIIIRTGEKSVIESLTELYEFVSPLLKRKL